MSSVLLGHIIHGVMIVLWHDSDQQKIQIYIVWAHYASQTKRWEQSLPLEGAAETEKAAWTSRDTLSAKFVCCLVSTVKNHGWLSVCKVE